MKVHIGGRLAESLLFVLLQSVLHVDGELSPHGVRRKLLTIQSNKMWLSFPPRPLSLTSSSSFILDRCWAPAGTDSRRERSYSCLLLWPKRSERSTCAKSQHCPAWGRGLLDLSWPLPVPPKQEKKSRDCFLRKNRIISESLLYTAAECIFIGKLWENLKYGD